MKNFWTKYKQVLGIITITMGFMSGCLTGTGVVLKQYIFDDEIEMFNSLVQFADSAKKFIIPSHVLLDSIQSRQIRALEGKHGKGYAVGLRWNKKEQVMEYRHSDGKTYPAYFNEAYRKWYWILQRSNGEPESTWVYQ